MAEAIAQSVNRQLISDSVAAEHELITAIIYS